MKKIVVNLIAASTLLSGNCVLAQTSELNSLMFVQASRLSLRETPDIQGQLKTLLTTNTPVRLESRQGEWCRVSTISQSNLDQRVGFVDCSFLSTAKLGLSQVDMQLAQSELSQKVRLDLLQKKFWISPSWDSMASYAIELDKIFPVDENKELLRPKRGELEAMKAFMQAGWNPANFEYRAAEPRSLPAKSLNFNLPNVSVSLFKEKLPHLVIAPYIGNRIQNDSYDTAYMMDVDVLLNKVLARREVASLHLSDIRGALQLSDYRFLNAWDMSGYEVQFGEQGLPVTGLLTDGSSIDNFILRGSTETGDQTAECDQIGGTLKFASSFSQKVAKQGVLALLVDPPPVTATKIKRTQSEVKPLSNRLSAKAYLAITGKPVDPATVSTDGYKGFFMVFDLDGDGIPDIAFEGIQGTNDLATGPDADRIYSVFVNLNGQWVTYGSFSQIRCAD